MSWEANKPWGAALLGWDPTCVRFCLGSTLHCRPRGSLRNYQTQPLRPSRPHVRPSFSSLFSLPNLTPTQSLRSQLNTIASGKANLSLLTPPAATDPIIYSYSALYCLLWRVPRPQPIFTWSFSIFCVSPLLDSLLMSCYFNSSCYLKTGAVSALAISVSPTPSTCWYRPAVQ